jgi:hypothetical protein
MRRHAVLVATVAATVGIGLFAAGWFVGWETFEPIQLDGLNELAGGEAGAGAFAGVITGPWELQTTWLTWVTGLAAIGLAVVLARFPSRPRAIGGWALILVGL